MYKGIVLSEVQRDAFLAVADLEGLICERGETDGIYKKMTSVQPAPSLLLKVFEQFVVAGKVYVDPFTYKCLDGKLIEHEIILPYEKSKHELDFQYFDTLTVQRMMVEKGYSAEEYTEEHISEIFYNLKEKVRSYLSFEDEYGLNYAELCIQRTLGFGAAVNSEDQTKFDHYFQLRDEIFHNPVYNTLTEYRKILNIAYNNDLLCPMVNIDNSRSKIPLMESDDAVAILKYTSSKLERISVAGTLTENVSLVQSEEAAAYRKKVDEWMIAISNQDFGNMQMIENDIEKAQRAMKWKNCLETTGKVIAAIGAASTAISNFCPKASVLANVMTYAGLVPAFYNPMKKYLWASFGLQQSNR